MADKSAECSARVTRNVTPFQPGDRVFYVEAEMLVPHRFLVAVSASDSDAACRLALNVVKHGKAYGIPDFSEASRLVVSSLRSGRSGETESTDRIEPIPAEHRRENVTRSA